MILSPFGPYIYKGKLTELVRKQLLADAFDAAEEGLSLIHISEPTRQP